MIRIVYNGDWHGQVALELYKYLISQGIECTHERRGSVTIGGKAHETKKLIYIFEGEKYKVIDFKDMLNPANNFTLRDLLPDPNCLIMLKCQYRPDHYTIPPYDKIEPYTYFEKDPNLLQYMRKRDYDKIRSELFFYGNPWQKRGEVLAKLGDIVIPNGPAIDISLYYRRCVMHKWGLALPGFGNVCHREIEYFGLGVATIMPTMKNKFHEDLVPGKHYVAVDVNTTKASPQEIADSIKDVWNKVKSDDNLRRHVVKNATEWYERNVMFPNSVALAARVLGLAKL